MAGIEIGAGKSNIETVQRSFAHAVGEIRHRFSPEASPKGFFIILQDGVTGYRFADSFSWRVAITRETSLKSQSMPYRINGNMLDMVDIVAESPVSKLLVCDEASAIHLWEWVVREQKSGIYLMQLRSGKYTNLYILDSDDRSFIRRTPIPQIPTSVLR